MLYSQTSIANHCNAAAYQPPATTGPTALRCLRTSPARVSACPYVMPRVHLDSTSTCIYGSPVFRPVRVCTGGVVWLVSEASRERIECRVHLKSSSNHRSSKAARFHMPPDIVTNRPCATDTRHHGDKQAHACMDRGTHMPTTKHRCSTHIACEYTLVYTNIDV